MTSCRQSATLFFRNNARDFLPFPRRYFRPQGFVPLPPDWARLRCPDNQKETPNE